MPSASMPSQRSLPVPMSDLWKQRSIRRQLASDIHMGLRRTPSSRRCGSLMSMPVRTSGSVHHPGGPVQTQCMSIELI